MHFHPWWCPNASGTCAIAMKVPVSALGRATPTEALSCFVVSLGTWTIPAKPAPAEAGGRNPGQWHQREASCQACIQHKERDGLQCSLSGLRLPAFAGTRFATMTAWFCPHCPCLGNTVFGTASWIPVPRLRGDRFHGNRACPACIGTPPRMKMPLHRLAKEFGSQWCLESEWQSETGDL